MDQSNFTTGQTIQVDCGWLHSNKCINTHNSKGCHGDIQNVQQLFYVVLSFLSKFLHIKLL